jgi:DNA repair exonuclease SbcCD ATPase subunit
MNEKNYKRKLDFQQKLIARQSEQIESQKNEIDKLKLELKEKDKMIHSVDSLRNELSQNISEIKKYKEEYKILIDEVRKMKSIINQDVYKNRWWLIKFLIK